MKYILIIALMTLGTALTAHSGGMTSSGGDTHEWGFESAWFLGTKPISYCVEVAPTETITRSQVASDFESSVKIWKKYYIERAPQLHDEERKLNFNFYLEECTSTTNLRILVGVDSDEIKEDRKKFFSPWGFVKRTEFDFDAGIGRGYIWFSPSAKKTTTFPQWSTPNVFHGALLHEVGHIYGCGHIENTIMDSDLISKFQMAASDDPNWATYGKMYMTSIDHHIILLFKDSAPLNLEGRIHLNDEKSKEYYEYLTGQPAHGQPRSRISIQNRLLKLTFYDDLDSHTFDIPLRERTSFSLGGQVFSAVKGAKGYSTGSSGLVYLSHLKTLNGEKLNVQVAINANELGWPVVIRFIDSKGQLQDIFGSDLWATAGLPK